MLAVTHTTALIKIKIIQVLCEIPMEVLCGRCVHQIGVSLSYQLLTGGQGLSGQTLQASSNSNETMSVCGGRGKHPHFPLLVADPVFIGGIYEETHLPKCTVVPKQKLHGRELLQACITIMPVFQSSRLILFFCLKV